MVSHRGQEQSSVALMGYKDSPPYVQRQTHTMLREYWEFTKTYVDDIVIYSHSLREQMSTYVERKLFTTFEEHVVPISYYH